MKYTFLHIEDDQEIGIWLREFLANSGYEVIWKQSGYEAMKYMEQVDLIILDIMIPGLDGYTVGQRMKRKYPDVPILLHTARKSMEDKSQGLFFAKIT